jgi:hypothetical protein
VKDVEVDFSEDGIPVSFDLGGQIWIVGAEPLRWYERRSWWETDGRMGRRPGESLRIEIDMWRLQATPGLEPSADLITFEIIHDETGRWYVRKQT